MKTIIVGGWSGCAAALTAAAVGAEVELLERTDMLLGTGLVGGIMRNNGRFTAAEEMIGRKGDQIGAMSGSCKLLKESLDPRIVAELDKTGVAVAPLPPAQMIKGKLALKCCQQYAIPEFEENIVLLDTGHAKLMTPYFPLELLQAVPGFENARYEDPYAGGLGNSICYIGMAPRDDALKVEGGRKPLLRGREGRTAGGPHRGHLHRRPGRL
jgi:hypothetical protein